jgi:galactitol-specific phosphotransferase system IIB component
MNIANVADNFVQHAVDNIVQTPEKTFEVGWTSLFLTRVNKKETVESLTHKLTNIYCIGVVKRIDFITKSKVFNEKANNYYQKYNSCFVHFHYWHNNVFSNELRQTLETTGKFNFYDCNGGDKFLAHINNNPIVDTQLNIHQLATNSELMEQNLFMLSTKLNEQYCIINQQQTYINQLVYDMNELKQKVYGDCR